MEYLITGSTQDMDPSGLQIMTDDISATLADTEDILAVRRNVSDLQISGCVAKL